jgi:hypothetical protein
MTSNFGRTRRKGTSSAQEGTANASHEGSD